MSIFGTSRKSRHLRVFRPFASWCGRLTLAASLAVAVSPVQSRTSHPALFGASEIRSDDLGMFTKWTAALDRAMDERRLIDAPCTAAAFNRCHLAEWRQFLTGISSLSRMAQLEAVNGYMNRKRYILDPRNYGVSDYWAAPGQFLSRDGDCEDYAIAKFMSLKALGFTNDDMRIVVLKDLNLGIAHAVLVVYVNGRVMVLDNQIDGVVDAASVRHYRPIYSINQRSWWLHRGGPETMARANRHRTRHSRYR